MALFRAVILSSLVFRVWAQPLARVLIFSGTNGFRHDSIPFATNALKTAGPSVNVQFDSTEDPAQFTDDKLKEFDALMFLSTTGEPLTANAKRAFYNYLDLGGNFIAVHAATACMTNDTRYRAEIGALFNYHPQFQNATVDVVGPAHPSTAHLPKAWRIQDEIYNFDSNPRKMGAVVVVAADESSYVDKGDRAAFDQGSPHPLAWYQEHGKGSQGIAGRSFYTALGHSNASWADPLYLGHVLGGVTWAIASQTTRATNESAALGIGKGDWTPGVAEVAHSESMVNTVNQLAPSASPSTSSSQISSTANSAPKFNVHVVLMVTVGMLSSFWVSR